MNKTKKVKLPDFLKLFSLPLNSSHVIKSRNCKCSFLSNKQKKALNNRPTLFFTASPINLWESKKERKGRNQQNFETHISFGSSFLHCMFMLFLLLTSFLTLFLLLCIIEKACFSSFVLIYWLDRLWSLFEISFIDKPRDTLLKSQQSLSKHFITILNVFILVLIACIKSVWLKNSFLFILLFLFFE